MPLRTARKPQHVVHYRIETLRISDGDRSLVPIGSLSNFATAMRMEPGILTNIEQIILMGGACGTGKETPSAEFNIAADRVFRSGVKLVMMGLNVTAQPFCTFDIMQRMKAAGNRAVRLFGDIMRGTLRSQ